MMNLKDSDMAETKSKVIEQIEEFLIKDKSTHAIQYQAQDSPTLESYQVYNLAVRLTEFLDKSGIIPKFKEPKPPVEYNCICCSKKLVREIGGEHDWEGGFNGGMVAKIKAGYGSRLDGDVYVIGICDDCAKIKNEQDLLPFIRNNIFPSKI